MIPRNFSHCDSEMVVSGTYELEGPERKKACFLGGNILFFQDIPDHIFDVLFIKVGFHNHEGIKILKVFMLVFNFFQFKLKSSLFLETIVVLRQYCLRSWHFFQDSVISCNLG